MANLAALRTLLIVLVCFCSQSVANQVLPTLPVETLSKKRLTIPKDLVNGPVVFIIGFTKSSRSQTTDWSRRLEEKYPDGKPGIYSMSVLEDVPRLIRGFVIKGIRKGVPKHLHDRFLLVLKESKVWEGLASLSEPDAAYILLMNVDRQIIWRESGALTEPGFQQLVDQIDAQITPD